jgi:hypothetical protein
MNEYLNNFKSLSDRTELLESLEWDEVALEQLHSFINMQKDCFVPTHPAKLLEHIEEFFGKPTKEVVAKIFKREIKKIKGSKNEN